MLINNFDMKGRTLKLILKLKQILIRFWQRITSLDFWENVAVAVLLPLYLLIFKPKYVWKVIKKKAKELPLKTKKFIHWILATKPRKITASVLIILLVIAPLYYSFFATRTQAAWWNDNWHYRKALTVNHSMVAADLTDFPVLVDITDTAFINHAQTSGEDFVFTTVNGTVLKHEIESYDSGNGILTAWVNVPELDGDHDSTIYVYYGNRTVGSQENQNETWNDNYEGVWHMNDDTIALDSTSNSHDGTNSGATETTGQIGNALNFEAIQGETTISTSNDSASTVGAGQRKTFYDAVNGRYWAFFKNSSAIEYRYSTDGSVWTLGGTQSYNTADFSISYKSGYVYLATQCSSYDICVKKGTLSTTSIAWGGEYKPLVGSSSTNMYDHPVITLGSSDYIWVAARKKITTSLYQTYAIKSSSAADPSGWSSASAVGFSDTDIETFSLVPGTSQQMYLVSGSSSSNTIGYLYNGSWSRANTGADFNWMKFTGFFGGTVRAIAVSGTDVYVGGDFTNAAGVGANRIVKWDGTSWSALGSGIDNGSVYAIAVSGSNVYIGGSFVNIGGAYGDRIVKWNGTSYENLGSYNSNGCLINGQVNTIAINGSYVYVGGTFQSAHDGYYHYLFDTWNGSAWIADLYIFSSGDTEVNSIVVSGGYVYVGGLFADAAQDSTIDNFAYCSNDCLKNTWHTKKRVGTLTLGVKAIAISGSGDIYIGGAFNNAGNNMGDKIAKWNGSDDWTNVGDDGAGEGALKGTVYSLAISGNYVYAGGAFTDVNGDPTADYIAKWDTVGSTWSGVGDDGAGGGFLGAYPNVITVYNNAIFTGNANLGNGRLNYVIPMIKGRYPSTVSDTSGNVHLLYQSAENGVSGYLRYREWSSSTWGSPVDIDTNSSGNDYFSIAVDTNHGNDIYAFWINNNYIYSNSASTPYSTWSGPTELVSTGTSNTGLTASYQDGNYGMYFMYSEGGSNPYNVKYFPAFVAGADVDVGNIGNIQSVSFWINIDSVTQKIIKLNGSTGIMVTLGNVETTGFTSDNVYVDGVDTNSLLTGWHHVVVTDGSALNASSAYLGRYVYGYLNGTLDEVRFNDTVLSQDWIETEYNNQSDPASFFTVNNEEQGPGPIAYWSFNDGNASTVQDETSNNYDGNITGADVETSDCVSGKCLYFNGSGDEVDAGDVEL